MLHKSLAVPVDQEHIARSHPSTQSRFAGVIKSIVSFKPTARIVTAETGFNASLGDFWAWVTGRPELVRHLGSTQA